MSKVVRWVHITIGSIYPYRIVYVAIVVVVPPVGYLPSVAPNAPRQLGVVQPYPTIHHPHYHVRIARGHIPGLFHFYISTRRGWSLAESTRIFQAPLVGILWVVWPSKHGGLLSAPMAHCIRFC